ncbi:MAG: hydroxyacylglutathione hydrolase [Stellaceae bacterium]
MTLEIQQIPALRDNYVHLLREPKSGAVGAVDPSVAPPVLAALSSRGWTLTHVINTHHHPDHTGGNLELKAATNAIVVGPLADKGRIPGIDVAVGDGDTFQFGDEAATVYDVPGHTRGHIAYWFKDSQALFSGDTLFLMGCGRLFEGTPQQMWTSLNKLKALPPATRVYCGHEYTQANARFALTIEPKNEALAARAKRVDATRAAGQSTVPGTMADELATNPFLRADVPDLQRAMGAPGDAVATFAAIRKAKDNF